MALTQPDWTVKTVNGKLVATATITGGASGDVFLSTKISPAGLDTSKPFTVIATTSENMTGSGNSKLAIYSAYSANASVGSTGTLTDCALASLNTNDLDAGPATGVIHVLPGVDGNVTQVTNASPGWSVIPSAPYFIFSVNTSEALNAAPASVAFVLIQ